MDGTGVDINELLTSPEAQAFGALMIALVIGYAVSTAVTGALSRATAKTQTDLDARLITILRRPIVLSALLAGIEWAGDILTMSPARHRIYDGVLGTLAILVWVVALVRAVDVLLAWLTRGAGARLRGRATSLLRYAGRLGVLGFGAYFFLLVWGLDLALWEVSAGVAGLVLVFAAEDSLRHVISGGFILGDAPLHVGDYVRVDRMRGRVTDIGWRSTRVLTNDGIVVVLPNALLAGSRVVNESAGPAPQIRLWCEFRTVHGVAPEAVAAAVAPGADRLPLLAPQPAPQVYFLGTSPRGQRFALLIHVADPRRQTDARDVANTHIYRRLTAAGISFAYSTHDVALAPDDLAALQAALAPTS